MSELKNIELDLYILNKSLLAETAIQEIEKKIKFNEDYRRKFIELKEFYEIFESLENESRENIIQLKLIEPDTDNSYRLAALHEEISENYYKHINTYITAEKLTISRLLQNKAKGEYCLYINSENDNIKITNALVYLPDLEKTFITDTAGFVKIKANYINPQSIIIKQPIAVFPKVEAESGYLSVGAVKLNVTSKNNIVHIKITSDIENKFATAYLIYSEDYVNYESYKIVDNCFSYSKRTEKDAKLLLF